MIKRVLIIGAYGNFGSFISETLAKENNIRLIISGRNIKKAQNFANKIVAKNEPEFYSLDINNNFQESLANINPDIVIHTSGPYQDQDYRVAEACIKQKCHYIDLADGREFVSNITTLNNEAENSKVLICSGASSVPCLTSSIIDNYKQDFNKLTKIEYAIATAHLTNRGLATIKAVLSYAGKPFSTIINGKKHNVYGWLGLTSRNFWKLNTRLLSNCNIPDLEIFPKRYPSLETINFRAGLELKLLHLILNALSYLVKIRIFSSLQPLSNILKRISFLFDSIGTNDSGFYMIMSGIDNNNNYKEIKFDLIARNGDGLCIPTIPSILLAKKLVNNEIHDIGAKPCLDLINMHEYLDMLSKFDIQWQTT